MYTKIKNILKSNKVILCLYANLSYLFKTKNYTRAKRCVYDFTKTKDEQLIKDICKSIVFNKIQPSEYFLFNFCNKTKSERGKFVGYSERQEICVLPSKDILQKFTNKYICYLTYREWYKRDVILISTVNDFFLFLDFVSTHKIFMIKTITGFKGKGVRKVKIDETTNLEKLFSEILSDGECVIEEIIHQSDEMGRLHPSSVNSIRFVTYFDNNKLTKLFALVRMGCGGSVVDNAGSGGIIAAVDINSGVVISDGYRENGEIHTMHPDSQIILKGYQIPKWHELQSLIEEVVKVVPQQKIIGWDFALTEQGWIIIEVNHRPSFTGIQMCLQKGIRELIEPTFNL